jgi:hypothetical protein
VVAVIGLIVAGIVLIALIAVVVGVVDAARAPAWRDVAAERRARWEERVRELHGVPDGAEAPEPEWDDD